MHGGSAVTRGGWGGLVADAKSVSRRLAPGGGSRLFASALSLFLIGIGWPAIPSEVEAAPGLPPIVLTQAPAETDCLLAVTAGKHHQWHEGVFDEPDASRV